MNLSFLQIRTEYTGQQYYRNYCIVSCTVIVYILHSDTI